jgi:hypothetical protein
MKSHASELEILLNEWENAFPSYHQKFVRDGIICETQYQKAKIKILFIVKEPNDPLQSSWDLTKVLNEYFSGNFSIRLSEWAYGILHDFPPLISLTDPKVLHIALKSVAIINLKKIGGGSISNMDEIVSHAIQNKSFLVRQIKLIDPDIIIGGVGQTRIWNLIFETVEFKRSDYDIMVGKWNNIKIIDYYHPCYQVPRAMSYSLLQNIYNSTIFNQL